MILLIYVCGGSATARSYRGIFFFGLRVISIKKKDIDIFYLQLFFFQCITCYTRTICSQIQKLESETRKTHIFVYIRTAHMKNK